MKIRNKRKWIFGVLILFFCAQWIRGIYPDQEKQGRALIYSLAVKIFPAAARQTRKGYGLHLLNLVREKSEYPYIIILIHGLDEPGKFWMNLAPVLISKDYQVYDMVYPNDQAISLSSEFFFNELKKWNETRPVSIIAHSMGGLVTRDMLTRPDLAYSAMVQKGRAPRVKQLIMIGTPNHGSQLVRFRMVTEIRDQMHHWLRKNAHPLHFLFDGTGAAAVDLIPGSKFLTVLDSRPHPQGVAMHIIAARVIPKDWKICDWIGDVLVTVESTRLKGVSHTLVPGTHLSMIRNLTSSSSRVPPAVPVVMDLLGQGS